MRILLLIEAWNSLIESIRLSAEQSGVSPSHLEIKNTWLRDLDRLNLSFWFHKDSLIILRQNENTTGIVSKLRQLGYSNIIIVN